MGRSTTGGRNGTSTSDGQLRVAVLAPMPSELRPLRKPLGLAPFPERGDGFLLGAISGIEVVAALTGIGMAAGARCAERIIDATSPDHLIVVGIAGGIASSVGIGDLVVPELVLNLDTGANHRPAAFGDSNPQGTLASSDTLLESREDALALRDRGVVAIDMESAAVAAVCERRGCAWSVFRAISDRADEGTTDTAILGLVDSDGTPNLAAVARFVLTRPHRIPQLVRLARGSNAATGTAADAAIAALRASGGAVRLSPRRAPGSAGRCPPG